MGPGAPGGVASRTAILLVLAVLAGGLLAGCTDRLQGVGTFRVVMTVSEESSFTYQNRVYQNKIGDFARVPAPLVSVVVQRGDRELKIEPERPEKEYDLVALQGGEAKVFEKKVVAGTLRSVSLMFLPFNATLLNGTSVYVNTTFNALPPIPYDFPRNVTIEKGGDHTFEVVFMITQGRNAGRLEYFLSARLAESGLR